MFEGPLSGRSIGTIRLDALIGSGSAGAVYRGRHTRLDKVVAVKVLRIGACLAELSVKRFLREGRAAARVVHPCVVQVLDAGEEDGYAYLTMEYVQGADLGAMVAAHGPLPMALVLRFALDMCAGLEAIHEGGILHRDIKPENCLVGSRDHRVRITDFGIAKIMRDEALTRLTRTGILTGTPSYVAPELIRDVRAATPASDVYSLAATLFHCLTGAAPFDGAGAVDVLRRQLHGPVPDLSRARTDLPIDLCRCLSACLDRSIGSRPALSDIRLSCSQLACSPA